MRKYLLAIALALAPLAAFAQGAGVSLVTTPPTGAVVPLLSTSPLNIGITADNFASWAGLTSSPGDTNIGTGVNKVSINGAATTVAPLVTVGGASSDTNIGLVLAGKGTGSLCLGGSTCANASASFPTTASAVNQVVITGKATGTAPTIAVGGSGADTNRNLSVAGAGTGIVTLGQAIATCSGTTTATCNGQRFVVSITGLTTAAGGVSSAAMVVTNSSILTSANMVWCAVNGYAGGGTPIATTVIPGTTQVSLKITNVADSGALDATVPVACFVQ